ADQASTRLVGDHLTITPLPGGTGANREFDLSREQDRVGALELLQGRDGTGGRIADLRRQLEATPDSDEARRRELHGQLQAAEALAAYQKTRQERMRATALAGTVGDRSTAIGENAAVEEATRLVRTRIETTLREAQAQFLAQPANRDAYGAANTAEARRATWN